ncbi:unnamed protein product [Arctogadus glacialis]
MALSVRVKRSLSRRQGTPDAGHKAAALRAGAISCVEPQTPRGNRTRFLLGSRSRTAPPAHSAFYSALGLPPPFPPRPRSYLGRTRLYYTSATVRSHAVIARHLSVSPGRFPRRWLPLPWAEVSAEAPSPLGGGVCRGSLSPGRRCLPRLPLPWAEVSAEAPSPLGGGVCRGSLSPGRRCLPRLPGDPSPSITSSLTLCLALGRFGCRLIFTPTD